jgi:Tfp pilus assembly protein FimT
MEAKLQFPDARERKAPMKRSKRNWHLTMVDFLVGVAVLMILTALVVPIFVPPNRQAAPRSAIVKNAVKLIRR